MKPNQEQYEKYFRRPLAWLLSFGMLASYVPVAHGQEGDTTEKDARTYYEDAPVGVTASTAMIPMAETDVVEGVSEEQLATVATSLADAIAEAEKATDGEGNFTFDGTLEAGSYILEDNLNLSDYGYNLKFVGESSDNKIEVTLDLNGYTLTGAGEDTEDDYGSVIFLNYADFTLNDSSNDHSGTITGGTGNFINNSMLQGGGICSWHSKVTINGGTIKENNLYSDIDRNVQYSNGGGIYQSGGELIINDGVISSNEVSSEVSSSCLGGGVYSDSGILTINGGSITNNTLKPRETANYATGIGGGLYAVNGNISISGGSIQDNSASDFGGGVYLDTLGILTLTGGSIIDNDAPNGDAIFLNANTAYLQGGTITGSIYLNNTNKLTLNSAFITEFMDTIEIEMQTNGIFTSGASNITDVHTYFESVDTDAYVLYDTDTNELKIGTLSLGFDNSDYGADTEITTTLTVSTNSTGEDGDSIDDLFDSLEMLQEQIQTAYKLYNVTDVTITYYKKKDNSQEAQTLSRSSEGDWEVLKDNDGDGDTAQEQAKKLLEESGTEIKVEYSIPNGDSPQTVATFIIESADLYTLTSVFDDKEGIFTLTDKDDEVITKAEEYDTVTITPKPVDGYELSEITVTYNDGTEVTQDLSDNSDSFFTETDGTYSFTMPAADVTVEVTFVEEKEDETTIDPVLTVYDSVDKEIEDKAEIEVEASDIKDLEAPTVTVTEGEDGDELTEGAGNNYTLAITYSTTDEASTTVDSLETAKTHLADDTGNTVLVTVTVTFTDNSIDDLTSSFTWESVEDEEESTLSISVPTRADGGRVDIANTSISTALLEPSFTVTLDGETLVSGNDYTSDYTYTYVDAEGATQTLTRDDANTYLQTVGNEVTVTITVDAGSDGTSQFSFTFVSRDANATIYDLSLNVGNNGIVWHNSAEYRSGQTYTGIKVYEGDSTSISIYPTNGYQIETLTLTDSKGNVTALSSMDYETLTNSFVDVTYYSYTIDNMDQNYTLSVTFEKIPSYYIVLNYNFDNRVGTLAINNETEGTLSETLDSNISRQGYTFGGWFKDNNTFAQQVTDSSTFTDEEEIYAKWTITEYTITADFNGGTLLKYEDGVKLPTLTSGFYPWTITQSFFENDPTQEGYAFKGWYLDDGITRIDQDYKFFQDSTITAHWYKLYTITLTYNDDSTSSTTTVTENDGTIHVDNLPTPTREGYQFDGWFTGDGTITDGSWGEKVIAGVGGTVFNNTTTQAIYAKWTEKTYLLELDTNYGESTTTVGLNHDGSLPQGGITDPTRNGWEFKGWYYDRACTEANKYDDKYFSTTGFEIGEVVDTLYAKWELLSYDITLHYNYNDLNGDDVGSYVVSTTDDTHHITDEKPTRTGYDFVNWYYDPELTLGPVDLTTTPFYEDTDLYAMWEEKTDTIILDPTGGTVANNITEVKINSDTGLISNFAEFQAIPDPERTGYTFIYWETDKKVEVTAETKFDPNDTIYALWEAIEYNLSFQLNGGIVDDNTLDTTDMPPIIVTYDQAIGTLVGGKKPDATFAGWHLLVDGVLAEDSSGNYIILDADTIWNYTEDQTVIAKYNFAIKATVEGEGTISTSYGEGIDSDNQIFVFEGDDIVFTYKADTGHRIKEITVDGVAVNLSTDTNFDKTSYTYTLKDVQKFQTIHFELEMVPIYEITITAQDEAPLTNGGFSTTSDFTGNVVYVTEGDTASIVFTPERGYYIDSVTANGVNLSVSDSEYPTTYTYKVTDIMNDVDLVVDIQELPRYTLTATSGENGSIDATNKYLGGLVSDKMEIYQGEDETFLFFPSVGYEVDTVTVTDATDSLEVTASTSYTMTGVMEDTKIHVTFKEIAEDSDDIVITLHANGGSLDGVSNVKTQEDGTLASMPSDPTRTGYIFNGWWNADNGGTQISTSSVFTQNTTIYAQWVADLTGVDYTVTFEANGGTTISNQLVSANGTLSKPTDPTRTGYTFDGWYTTSLLTTAWNFSDDIVSKDMTLYAKWTANATDSSTSVSRVVDHNGNPVVGATVTLMRNGSTYYAATTDSDGYYAFSLLVAGSYNLVVSTLDGYEKTTAVTIYNSSTTLPLVQLPEHNISSSSSISTGSLAQVVGGLDTLANLIAAKTSNFSKVLVDIAISSYTSTSSQSTITNAKQSTDVIASFFDVDLTKTVTTTTGLTYSDAITDADSLVEIVLSIPTVYQGKDSYSIYRIHNGSVDRITSSYNSNSERVVLSTDGTKLSLFVKKFSAFALAYSDSESTATTEHDVNVKNYLNGVESSSTSIGSVAVSSSSATQGDVVTVTPYPNFGFSLDNVVVKTDAGKYLTVTTNSNGTYSFAQTSSNATVYVYFTTTLNSTGGSLSDSNASTSPQISYFSDVNVTDTFCSAINEVVSLGLMSGTGNGTFSPHDSITRGMIVSILQYMSGEKTALTPGFSDVYPSDYYYYAVAWGESSGVISGYDDNTYRPNQAITREELAAILYRYSQKYGNYDVLWYFPLSFSDTESVTFWAKDAVTWCVNRDVLSARYNNFFLPQAVSTRAEVAVAVVALLNSQS